MHVGASSVAQGGGHLRFDVPARANSGWRPIRNHYARRPRSAPPHAHRRRGKKWQKRGLRGRSGRAPCALSRARQLLLTTAEGARELSAVSHWWTATLAAHLIDELWRMSLHQQVPELPPHHEDYARWHEIRRGYIQRLRRGRRAAIELWPSQLAAAKRAQDLSDDLVVALPTSAVSTAA